MTSIGFPLDTPKKETLPGPCMHGDRFGHFKEPLGSRKKTSMKSQKDPWCAGEVQYAI